MRKPARRTVWVGFVLIPVFCLVCTGTALGLPKSPIHPFFASAAGTSCMVGKSPDFPAYDPANRLIYVPNTFSSNVSVINGTCGIVGSIALPKGSNPIAAAYDPLDRDVYVTDNSVYDVYVIHNLSLVHTIHKYIFNGGTSAVAWDPSANLILCVSRYAIVGISGTTINGSTKIGNAYAGGMAFDAHANEILVAQTTTHDIVGVNASHPFTGNHLLIRGVNVRLPFAIAYDPVNGVDYVTDAKTDNVTVINGSSGSVLKSIHVGRGPTGLAFDPAKKEVFVANGGSNSISVIRGFAVVRTLAFALPNNYFYGVVYDSSTKLVYVTGLNYKVFIVS